MKKLLTQCNRIFNSLQRFFKSLVGKATTGTGTAVRTVAGAIGAGAALIMFMVIIFIIGLGSIPFGAFAAAKSPMTQEEISANANPIADMEPFCINCGDTESPLNHNNLCCECTPKNGENDEKAFKPN